MEFAWLEGKNSDITRNTKMTTDTVLSKMQNFDWTMREAGNGEQNVWFCWAMARMRKHFGLKVEPGQY